MKNKTKQFYLKKKPSKLRNQFNVIGDVVYDDLFNKVCKKKDYFNEETMKLLKEKYR